MLLGGNTSIVSDLDIGMFISFTYWNGIILRFVIYMWVLLKKKPDVPQIAGWAEGTFKTLRSSLSTEFFETF